MKLIKFILPFVLITYTISAQKVIINEFSYVDRKALQLPDSLSRNTNLIASYINSNFLTEKDKSRAIFIWVASTIEYDIDNMFAINFYEKKEDKIEKPLKSRKGNCENYAALFTDICKKTGIKSFIIEGYTKQNGFTDYVPHAWSAALIDSSWFLFDPTWGSGYINEGRFFRKINNSYYKASPSMLIKSHMPFDYLWQFLNYPVTNQEFYEDKTQQNKTKSFFSFNDTLQVYEKQTPIEQLISSAYRVEKNGVKNSLVFDRLHHLKLSIEYERQTKTVNLYNSAVVDFNDGIRGAIQKYAKSTIFLLSFKPTQLFKTMNKEEFLALAEAQYESLHQLKEQVSFYDYEKSFDALWIEFGRQVLEKNIGNVPKDRQKKTFHVPATEK